MCTHHEYSCQDGTCVDLDSVCDGKIDCNDKSDEVGCQSIKFDGAYLKNLPPAQLVAKTNDKKVEVGINLTVLSILQLHEIHSNMKLQLELQVWWNDPRLEFSSLRKGKQQNAISLEQKKKLWLPTLAFTNNKEKMRATFDDDNSIGHISLNTNATSKLSPLHSLWKTRIFSGKQG